MTAPPLITRAKPWDHFPSRLYEDDRYLQFSAEAGLALHRLYIACDRHGHFAAGEHVLPGVFRLRRDIDTEAVWSELLSAGADTDAGPLVEQFVSTEGLRCGRLVDYDIDSPRQVVEKRKKSDYQPVQTSSNQFKPVQTSSNKLSTCAREETETEIETETPPSGGDIAGAPTHTREDGSALGDPAKQWLHHRIAITKGRGDFTATWARGVELHGPELERLQSKPGFSAAVQKMLRMPDSRWGKTLRGGIGLLRSMVANHIPDEEDRASPVDQHFTKPLSREEFDRCETL
jgi:hypothetical protein